MPLPDDRKFDECRFYDGVDSKDLTAAAFTAMYVEKEHLLNTAEKRPASPRKHFASGFVPKLLLASILGSCLTVILMLQGCLSTIKLQNEDLAPTIIRLVKDAIPASTSGVTEDFQVYQPVFTPSGVMDETTQANGSENTTTIAQTNTSSSCQVVLMQHSFAFSYGIPFVGVYTPPNCKFNRVTMNFTVTVKGRQFDRLALMYFNDTEVWRTSTAEPTQSGVRWEYIKDMTEFMYFWKSPQKLIFDLGNLVDATYTGIYNTTLTATFFTAQDTVEPADLILPISARQGAANAASVFTLPSVNASNTITFPRNANRAVFTVSASGSSTEEFWWSNVLQSNIDTFDPYDGTLYGYSPFREVQVLIDGQLAGVQWPFPVIFTGGVVPGLWRPIVGLDAFDLREHEIDITPWLPVLSDGKEHTFEIRVAGIIDDGKKNGYLTPTVGSNWLVTGKVFVWLDDEGLVTTGSMPSFYLPPPAISISQSYTQNSTGANQTLTYTTNVNRYLSISSYIVTQHGRGTVSWTQNLATTNYGQYTDAGAIQVNQQGTHGTDQSQGGVFYKASYSYPLWANSSYFVEPSGNFTLEATVSRGLVLDIQGTPVFPTGLQPFKQIPRSAPLVSGFSGTSLNTIQNGSAYYFASPSAGISTTYGSTNQDFTFSGIDISAGVSDTELYYRSVAAVNGTIVRDKENLVGMEVSSYGYPIDAVPDGMSVQGLMSPKAALGRGPGDPKQQLVQGVGS